MISVIPNPLSVKELEGNFEFADGIKVSGAFGGAKRYFCDVLADCSIKSDQGKDFVFVCDPALGEEEYKLTVTPEKASVFASSEAGAFYGAQTFRLASELDTDKKSIACTEIHDKPRFRHRGFMFDVARHFFDKEYIKKTLDMMSILKLNTFHWHLSDDQGWRIEIKKYPLLTEKGTTRGSTAINSVGWSEHKEARINKPYGEGKFYTQEDIREVVEYAAERHINIIPEIDMPGHLAAAIACYPELSCTGKQIEVSDRWGVIDVIGCCGKQAIYKFVENVIDELVELFPYEYIHIGGDEVPKDQWKICPDCQAKISKLGLKDENELQGDFNNFVLAYLKSKNRKMIGWNEILDASTLSDETVVQWWCGEYKENGVEKWLEKGNNIVISYAPFVYMDHMYCMKDLPLFYKHSPETLGLDNKYFSQVLGMEAPVWTEYIRDTVKLEFNIYPRLQALSEICWSAENRKDFADFEKRLAVNVKLLDAKGINHAPEECYDCSSDEGRERQSVGWDLWAEDPYYEVKKFSKIQPSDS